MTDEERKQNLGRSLFDQCLKLFINPELESRYEKKQVSKPFPYTIAQVIFLPDGKRTIVKFDDEVVGKIFVRMKGNVGGSPHFEYSIKDIEAIRDVEFDRNDYPDCDHATFFRQGEEFWHASYDLKYDKDLSARHLANARMFFQVAEDTLRRQHWPAFVDNLYSACELTAKGTLIAIPDMEIKEYPSHRAVKSRFNFFVIHDVVPEKHQKAFNKLFGLRDNARYMRGPLNFSRQEAEQLFEDVKEMIEQAERQL